MKFIVGLSSLALFSLSSASPCLAATQLVSSLPSESLPSTTKTIQVANSFGSVTQIINTVDREIRNRERARQRQERLNTYRQRNEQRRREREAARQRREAYLQSLTPQERERFLAAERERNAKLWGTLIDAAVIMAPYMGNGSSSGGTGSLTPEDCFKDTEGRLQCMR